MKTKLRVLIVEDSEDDTFLLLSEIGHGVSSVGGKVDQHPRHLA